MRKRIENFFSLLAGAIIGWLVGTSVALVVTPHAGEKNRAMLQQKSQEIKDRTAHTLEDARVRAEELARKSATRVTEIKQQGEAVLNEQKIGILSAIQGVKEGVRTYAEQGSEGQETAAIQPAPPSELSTELLDTNTNI